MAPSKFLFNISFAFLALLLLFLLLSQNLSSDYCSWRVGRRRCISGMLPVFRASQSRKMLREMKKEMEEEVDGRKRRRPTVEWDQLRRVPSGPDPLHHNGGSPKKPRTP